MSLGVYLKVEEATHKCSCAECGNEHETKFAETLYEGNITHNLNKMAKEAGIYTHLWEPEKLKIVKAKDLIEPLKVGLELLKSNSEHFEKFNSPNGWGLYENFVPFVEEYLTACNEFPNSIIRVDR